MNIQFCVAELPSCIYIYIYVCVCVCACVRAANLIKCEITRTIKTIFFQHFLPNTPLTSSSEPVRNFLFVDLEINRAVRLSLKNWLQL